MVTSFFLGLALGSLFVGRHLRSRRWSPLVVYGLFELGIGAFALAFPWLFAAVDASYGALYPVFAGSGTALFALRFALLFVFFLAPTFLMGARKNTKSSAKRRAKRAVPLPAKTGYRAP